MSNDLSKFNLAPDKTVLVVVDIQERLVSAMPQDIYLNMRNTVRFLLQAAGLFGIPVVTTEQYPKGIGHTVPELAGACQGTVVEKVSFGCCGEPNFMATLQKHNRSQVIITGMEAHVCVLQTALELSSDGFDVFVAADAVCSRNPDNRQNALDRIRQAGATVTNTESVLFEWLRDAGHEHFKAISKLVR